MSLRESCSVEYLDVPAAVPQHIEVDAAYVPAIKTLRETQASEVLPLVATPSVDEIKIIETERLQENSSLELSTVQPYTSKVRSGIMLLKTEMSGRRWKDTS